MSSDLLILLLMVVVVLAGSALCSGVEAALLSVNPVRLHELASRTKPEPTPAKPKETPAKHWAALGRPWGDWRPWEALGRLRGGQEVS